MTASSELKLLSCAFLSDVLCSYRKDARSWMMFRCWECHYYKRFERVMLAKDEKIMDEIDEERGTGVSK